MFKSSHANISEVWWRPCHQSCVKEKYTQIRLDKRKVFHALQMHKMLPMRDLDKK